MPPRRPVTLEAAAGHRRRARRLGRSPPRCPSTPSSGSRLGSSSTSARVERWRGSPTPITLPGNGRGPAPSPTGLLADGDLGQSARRRARARRRGRDRRSRPCPCWIRPGAPPPTVRHSDPGGIHFRLACATRFREGLREAPAQRAGAALELAGGSMTTRSRCAQAPSWRISAGAVGDEDARVRAWQPRELAGAGQARWSTQVLGEHRRARRIPRSAARARCSRPSTPEWRERDEPRAARGALGAFPWIAYWAGAPGSRRPRTPNAAHEIGHPVRARSAPGITCPSPSSRPPARPDRIGAGALSAHGCRARPASSSGWSRRSTCRSSASRRTGDGDDAAALAFLDRASEQAPRGPFRARVAGAEPAQVDGRLRRCAARARPHRGAVRRPGRLGCGCETCRSRSGCARRDDVAAGSRPPPGARSSSRCAGRAALAQHQEVGDPSGGPARCSPSASSAGARGRSVRRAKRSRRRSTASRRSARRSGSSEARAELGRVGGRSARTA